MSPRPLREWFLLPVRWVARAVVRLSGTADQKECDRRSIAFRELVAEGVVEVGPHSYGAPEVVLWRDDEGRPVGGRVRVGRYTSIADDVTLLPGGEHQPGWISTFPFRVQWGLEGAWRDGHPATKGDIVIGNDVWIARDATVLSGVTIGDGAVVAAGAVVTRDVRPYAVVAGNPAQELSRRFDDADIEFLLELCWWDWSDADVRQAVDVLCSPDLDRLRTLARQLGRLPRS